MTWPEVGEVVVLDDSPMVITNIEGTGTLTYTMYPLSSILLALETSNYLEYANGPVRKISVEIGETLPFRKSMQDKFEFIPITYHTIVRIHGERRTMVSFGG